MKQIRVKREPGIEALTHRLLRSRVVQSAISYYQINQKKPKVDTPLVILHAGIAKNILSDVTTDLKRLKTKRVHRQPTTNPLKILVDRQKTEKTVIYDSFPLGL